MPLIIERGNITHKKVDIIVNTSNPGLRSGGGVNGAIHRAAGPQLDEACKVLGGCKPGQAKVTPSFNLNCKYIIHTVGPVWHGGNSGEFETLASCYRSALSLALENECSSIAFPLISSGAYGFPKEIALRIAISEISKFLVANEMDIFLVIYDKNAFVVDEELLDEIGRYINKCNLETRCLDSDTFLVTQVPAKSGDNTDNIPSDAHNHNFSAQLHHTSSDYFYLQERNYRSLDDALRCIDEGFVDMLLRKIDEKGMKDSECYKRANMQKQIFWKIKNYKKHPSKNNVLAFAIALKLTLPETNEMLMKAGYALSHSNVFDIIVEYCIKEEKYDINEINMILFNFDQSLLGS